MVTICKKLVLKIAGLSILPTTMIESFHIYLLLLLYLRVGAGSLVAQDGLKLLIRGWP